jgi:site-specific DNA recombinase
MKAAIYTRVSTDEQAKEGFSLTAQKEICLQYIKLQNWEFIGEYCDDGYSARSLEGRPGVMRLRRDFRDKIDVVVVYKLDRIVRSVPDLHVLLDEFKQYNVKFASVVEAFDTTTAMGRLFLNNVAAMAQWERENISERVKLGMEQRALQGKTNGGEAPYGYRNDGKKLVVNPAEAEIVRMIYKLSLRWGMQKICRHLNDRNIPSPGGSKWGLRSVQYILNNPIYIGKIRYGLRPVDPQTNIQKLSQNVIIVDGDHEPILTKDEFEASQKAQQKRREMHEKNTAKAVSSDYPFTPALVCNRCGRRMVGKKRKIVGGYAYDYQCPGHYHQKICDMPNIGETVLEAEFMKYIEDIFTKKDIASFRPPAETPKQVDSEKLIRELENIKSARKKWQLAYGEGIISLEDLKELMDESKRKEKQIKSLLREIEMPNDSGLEMSEFIEMISDMKHFWHTMTRSERKQMMLALVKRIKLDTPVKGKGIGTRAKKTPCTIISVEFN